MKQFSVRYRKALAFLGPLAWFMAMGAAMFAASHFVDYGWCVVVGGTIWIAINVLCDVSMPLLWLRCYCEVVITQALQQSIPVLDQLRDTAEIDIFQPNPKSLACGVIIFVTSFVPVVGWVSFVICVGMDIVYLCLTLGVGLRFLAAYCYNVKNQDKYVPVCQTAELCTNCLGGTVIQYNLISVAELHQTLSLALKAAKRRP